jgi:hypothetical protein
MNERLVNPAAPGKPSTSVAGDAMMSASAGSQGGLQHATMPQLPVMQLPWGGEGNWGCERGSSIVES